MTKKFGFLAICFWTGLLTSCGTAPTITQSSSGGAHIFSDSHMKENGIPRASFQRIVIANLSRLWQNNAITNKEIIELLARTDANFNRLMYARKMSGKGPDAISDNDIIEKYKSQLIGISPEGKVYVDLKLTVDLVGRNGAVKKYSDNVGGFEATYKLDSYSNPHPDSNFANKNYINYMMLNPNNISLTIPYNKMDYQQQVHDAILSNKVLEKIYYARLVLKIIDCNQPKKENRFDQITCQPQLVNYQVFDAPGMRSNHITTAVVKLNRN